MQLTIYDMQQAVEHALRQTFPQIPVTDQQSGDGPQLIVQMLETRHEQEMGRRYRRTVPFLIRLVQEEKDTAGSYQIAEQLVLLLQQIELAGFPCRGQAINFELKDNVLHFKVTYSLLLWQAAPAETGMNKLEQKGTISNG